MKLEVGMYVRTKWGIAKIIDISKDFYETICYVDRCFQPIDETKCDKKELQQRTDKAIEYIETHKRKDEFLELNEWGTRELLEILKGDNK